ncbi:AAWKG family protein [Streptomyces sp. NPDC058955]|uniref:AAWKG family protein n=1 Tax=unclassified Streptomyces TaxID=2593676 RepID=UPI0036555FAD
MPADQWATAVQLLTGYPMPDRSELFKDLAGSDGKTPLMNVTIESRGNTTAYNALGPNVGPGVDGHSYVIGYYTGFGEGVNLWKVTIDFLWDPHARPAQSGSPLDNYIFGSRALLDSIVNNPFSSQGRSYGGLVVEPQNAVNLRTFSDIAGALDRTALYFTEQEAVLKQWADALDADDAVMKGSAADAFGALVQRMNENYRGYKEQLTPPGFSPTNFALHPVHGNGASRTRQGNALIGAANAVHQSSYDLVTAWHQWAANPLSNPMQTLENLIWDVCAWIQTYNMEQVVADVTSFGDTASTYTVGATASFQQSHPLWGDLSQMDTWGRIGNEAVRRWNEAVDSMLVPAGNAQLSIVNNAFIDASAPLAAPLTTRNTSPLGSDGKTGTGDDKSAIDKALDDALKDAGLDGSGGGGKGGEGGLGGVDGLGEDGQGGSGEGHKQQIPPPALNGPGVTGKGLPNVTGTTGTGGSGGSGGGTSLPDMPGQGGTTQRMPTPALTGGVPGGGSRAGGTGTGTGGGSTTQRLPSPDLTLPGTSGGSGLPGSGRPGSGLPGSGIPGSGLPGSGRPGSGLPHSGLPGSGLLPGMPGYPSGGSRTSREPVSGLKPRDDGGTVTTLPDGSTRRILPDGSIVTTSPDGTKVTRRPDGTTETVKPDGTKTTTRPGGTTVTIEPDGTKRVLHPGGLITITTPDGDTSYISPDGKQSATRPDQTLTSTSYPTLNPPGLDLPGVGGTEGYDTARGSGSSYGGGADRATAERDTRTPAMNTPAYEETGYDVSTDFPGYGTDTLTGGSGGVLGGAPAGPGGPAPMMPGMGGAGLGGQGGGATGGSDRVRDFVDEPAATQRTAQASGHGGGGTPFMPPPGGQGGGQQTQSNDRERANWLAEDEDVWGTEDDGNPAVLGREEPADAGRRNAFMTGETR